MRLGGRSAFNLTSAVKCLQDIVIEASDKLPFVVVEGHVGYWEQTLREKEGDVPWPNSPHNRVPSRAVNIIPSPMGRGFNRETVEPFIEEFGRLAAKHKVELKCKVERGQLHLEVLE